MKGDRDSEAMINAYIVVGGGVKRETNSASWPMNRAENVQNIGDVQCNAFQQ